MPQLKITDTVLRDGHQSLIATRLRTEDMLPICERLDKVGFWSLEVWGGATFDACVRFLKEDPWERLRQLRDALPKTSLQMLLRGQNLLGYRHYSDDVVEDFIRLAAKNGIDIFRIFDAMNDLRNLEVSIAAVKKASKHAQGAICYTTSPVHTIEQFVDQALTMQKMGCDSIAIKDMAGLLTPAITADLVGSLVQALDVPVHLHTHATAGLASMCHFKAVENGASGIDTAISAFAGGTSHSPTESMVCAFRDTEYDTRLDLPLLQEIGFYFFDVRKKYHQFESEYTGVDTRVQVNQVPGGMISNLSHQLKEQDALQRMNEVLDEIPRVRADLGYPPLVTPTSQIVGTQAVMNVLADERYKAITNEVKYYLQGRYGKPPGEVNASIRHKAIGREEVITCRPADLLPPEMDKLRKEIGELATSEMDILTYAMFPDIGRNFLEQRAAGTLVSEPLIPNPIDVTGGSTASTEFNITFHGETYHIMVTGTGLRTEDMRPYFINVDGVPEELLVESLQEIPVHTVNGEAGTSTTPAKAGKRPRATAPGHVTTSMPGTIVEVLVNVGDEVKAGAPVLITEAMKMETEIQAPVSGIVQAIHINKGDSVTPDEALVVIE